MKELQKRATLYSVLFSVFIQPIIFTLCLPINVTVLKGRLQTTCHFHTMSGDKRSAVQKGHFHMN